ncbi:MAG TPA: hemerythrin domain-containing protein [Dehalococcoidia bacterium]|nr:hemerythrin domain-containing protein [Dehalococcoidia bacterium]
MTSTDALRRDHEVIERALRVMERAALRLEAGQTLSPEVLSSAVDFVRNFADGCHHAKEELALFPRLVERGLMRDGGPIGVMLHEHDLGRAYIRRLEDALDRDDREATVDALQSYTALLRNHILKENEVLFPMADRLLSDTDQRELLAAFERIERDRIGATVLERYGALLSHIERAVR